MQVNSTSPCEGGPTHGYCDDTPEPTVLSPGQLCFGYAHPVSPGSTELTARTEETDRLIGLEVGADS